FPPSSFLLHPSSFLLHPSSFLLPMTRSGLMPAHVNSTKAFLFFLSLLISSLIGHCRLAWAQERTSATGQNPTEPPPATDSLGGPRPKGAKLGLGTSRFRPPSGVTDLALSPDETIVVTAGGELIVWDATTGK